MPTVSLTAEQKREAVELVNRHGSIPAAAAVAGINVNTFRHRYRQGVKDGLDDALVHPAPSGHTIKGVSTLYDAGGNVAMQWVKTRTDELPLDDIIEAVRGALDAHDGQAPALPLSEHTEPELATVYPLADWHIGLLAWGRETGEDWDVAIAQDRIRKAMSRLVAATPRSEHAVVLGLGDLLHADGYEGVTAKSKHRLDVDGRWPKVLRAAVELVIYTIDLALQKHETVLVRLIPGNHDDQSAIAVSLALAMFYSKAPRVTVDDDPGRYWWWRWGKVFLGAAHGDMAKMQSLPLIMAAQHPADWGASTHRMIFTGHIHHRTKLNADEVGGVDVESFNTPTPKDAWGAGAGFVSKRSVHAITFHNLDGEVSRTRVSL
jgi:hypothetical protein